MSQISIINLSTLKSYKQDFSNEKDNYDNNTHTTFLNGYISNCSDPIVKNMFNALNAKYTRIKNGYQQIDNWCQSYIENVEGIENALSNNGSTGLISESTIRNFITSQLGDLPSYKVDFFEFKFKDNDNFKLSPTKTVKTPTKRSRNEGKNTTVTQSILASLGNWWNDTTTAAGNFFSNVGATVATGAQSVWNNVGNWFEDTTTSVGNFFSDAGATVAKGAQSAWTNVGNWWNDTTESVGNFFADAGAVIATTAQSAWTGIGNWWNDSTKAASKFFSDTSEKISDFFEKNDKPQEKLENSTPNNNIHNNSSENITYYEDGSYSIRKKENLSEYPIEYYYDKNDVLIKFNYIGPDGWECIVKDGNPEIYDAYDKNGVLEFRIDENGVEYWYNKDGSLESMTEGSIRTYYRSDGSIDNVSDKEKATYYNKDGQIRRILYYLDNDSKIKEIEYTYATDGTKYEYISMNDKTVKLIEHCLDGTTVETVGKRSGGMRLDDGTSIPMINGITTRYDATGAVISVTENGITTINTDYGTSIEYGTTKYVDKDNTTTKLDETLNKYNLRRPSYVGLGTVTENYDKDNNLVNITIINNASRNDGGRCVTTYTISPNGTMETKKIEYNPDGSQDCEINYASQQLNK